MQLRVLVARLQVSTASALAAVLVLAALVRVVSYVQVRDGSILYFHLAAGTGMHEYDAWARQIESGVLATPRPHQQPLYAHLLAASYRVFGPHVGPVLAWQALLGMATVALVFVTARAMWDEATAVAAGALAALYAPFVFHESTLLRATLFAFLTMAAVAAATIAARRRSPWAWMAAGSAAGLGVLAHAAGVLPAAALPLAARGRRAACVAAYVGGLVLALSPLAFRNAALGQPVWRTGAAAYGAHSFVRGDAADADPAGGFPFSPSEGRIIAASDARVPATIWKTLAAHPNPLSWLGLMGRKLLAFLDGWENAGDVNFYYFLAQSPALATFGVRLGLLLPLAALGFAFAAQAEASSRSGRLVSPAAMAIAGGLLTALLFFTSSRVRLASAAAMIPFAAAGIVEAARRLRGREWRSLAAPATTAIIMAVVAAAPWWPREHLVRDLDYRTGNVLAVARWQHERRMGRPARGLRVLEKQLSTEPSPLRTLAPGSVAGVPEWAARVAGSFAELHRAAAAAQREAGRLPRALAHAEHAKALAILARGYADRARS